MTDLDSPAVWSALEYELEGTWSLLGQSERMLRDLRVVTEDYDPLFACLATGAEKLLKIVHGLVVEDEQGQWPSKASMSTTYSHAILDLDALCRGHIRDRLHTATSSGYIGGLLAAVDDDQVIRDLLEAVNHYARQGRFHNLDTLADGPPDHPSPRVLFETLELEIWKREGLGGQLGKDQPAFDAALAQGNLVLRSSLIRWWELYYRAAQHGVLGPRAKRWLSTGSPPPVL
ncbi:MAG: hypothetical protein H0U09_06840 [Geodermatophilaceae bacterium]|nr:hypothetical protein [Geodermatophilaceae bacterium]